MRVALIKLDQRCITGQGILAIPGQGILAIPNAVSFASEGPLDGAQAFH